MLLNVTSVKVRPEAFSSMLAERAIGLALLLLLDLPAPATMVVSVMQRIIMVAAVVGLTAGTHF